VRWAWASAERVTVIGNENGIAHSRSILDPEIVAWIAAGNRPDEPPPEHPSGVRAMGDHPESTFAVKTAAGLVTCFTFKKAGHLLKMHDHEFGHYSQLLRGAMRVRRGDGLPDDYAGEMDGVAANGDVRVIDRPLDRVFFPAGQFHEITAEQPDTVILQIQLDEEPKGCRIPN
jgi:hypothetical protein